MPFVIRSLPVIVAFFIGLPSIAAAQENRPISDYFGSFIGRSVSTNGAGLAARDLSVTIEPTKEGFNLTWVTVIHRNNKKHSRKSYSIDFTKTSRKGIWGSAVRRDAFGGRRSVDPLREDVPFVWATLKGATLTVNALLIIKGGGYELQTYERTLIKEGMKLSFTRLRNGERLKQVTGVMTRMAR
ncbi:MAG: hypothetical protein ACTSUD_09300 [Alphaproteobacteria bacterium]